LAQEFPQLEMLVWVLKALFLKVFNKNADVSGAGGSHL
jgi:hypothetical protein